MKRPHIHFIVLSLIFVLSGCSSIDEKIEKGQYQMAKKQINKSIGSGELTPLERIALEEKADIMHRIELDFNKSREDVLEYIKAYYPNVSEEQMRSWEESNELENMIINGEKRYFSRSHANLFRINKEAKARKIEVDGNKKDGLLVFLEQNIPNVIHEVQKSGKTIGKPVKMKFTYTLTVDADAVPAGEMIRCWLPFPKEGNIRQQDVTLISTSEDEFILAPNTQAHRTLYMQKPAVAGKATEFEIEFSTTTRPQWFDLENMVIKPYDKNSEEYKHYTAERDPHLLFTPSVKALSQQIVGDEKDPYQIAKKIFNYITDHYPWAGAREYSTIENIPDYVIANNHGDCGQVTLLFMVLCRYNGIPARWESGWMLHPGNKNLHDWGQVYFEGPGWVPVDQSFGRQQLEDNNAKEFYLGGIDAYRLIVNDDFGQALFPAKQFLRSETNDFQRGEVEWRGGNLYFNTWDYHMELEYLNQ
jgi:hypothetical protein